MFTSRAEYRLRLRADNADQRLTSLGQAAGLVGTRRWAAFEAKRAALNVSRETLQRLSGTPQALTRRGLAVNADGQRRTAWDLLGRPAVQREQLVEAWPALAAIAAPALEQRRAD